MKALLVTSEVTFVPDNYASFVQELASNPYIGGLLIIKNSSLNLLIKSLRLLVAGAPKLGWTLIKNYWQGSSKHQEVYQKAGKPIWLLDSINNEEALRIVMQNKFDLIINARTRSIFKRPILEMPSLGCINIHHGLLPNQRGLMCDLWALSEAKPAGFTIHIMNKNIDDGEILEKVIVSDGKDKDFIKYVQKSSEMECQALKKLLAQIAAEGFIEGLPNLPTEKIMMKKTPSMKDIKDFKRKGLIL